MSGHGTRPPGGARPGGWVRLSCSRAQEEQEQREAAILAGYVALAEAVLEQAFVDAGGKRWKPYQADALEFLGSEAGRWFRRVVFPWGM